MLVRMYVARGPTCGRSGLQGASRVQAGGQGDQGNGEMTRGGVEAVTHHAPHLTSHGSQRLQREGHSCFISDIISSVLISIQLWHVCMKFVTKLNIYLNYLNLTFNSFEFFAIVFHSIEIGILKVYFFH